MRLNKTELKPMKFYKTEFESVKTSSMTFISPTSICHHVESCLWNYTCFNEVIQNRIPIS